MITNSRPSNPARWLTSLLVGASLAACSSATHPLVTAGETKQHVIHLFGPSAPPLTPTLTAAQADHRPSLPFSYGPAYQGGKVIGLAVRMAGCQKVRGALVSETATTVIVKILGKPWQDACIGSLVATEVSVKLSSPLGHRKEIYPAGAEH